MEKNCNSNDLDVSKRNLKKIQEARESGKLKRLESDLESCSLQNSQGNNQPPVPIWYPKRVPNRILVRDLPDIPTYKIRGTFDSSSNIQIDGGQP